MNILLIGEHFSENMGDPLLCQMTRSHLQKEFPNATIDLLDLSGRLDFNIFVREYTPLKRILYKAVSCIPELLCFSNLSRLYKQNYMHFLRVNTRLNELLRAKKYDLAVFAGGSLFMQYFAGVVYVVCEQLRKRKVKTVFHACGMDYLSEDAIHLFRKTVHFPNIVSVSLRDSYERFYDLFNKNGVRTFDTALGVCNVYKASASKSSQYGIGIIGRWEHYEPQLRMVKKFLKSPYTWKLFTNGNMTDYQMARRLLEDAGVSEDKTQDYLSDRPMSPQELVTLITGFENIISPRLHSLIVAASYGIPYAGILCSDKVLHFCKHLARGDHCLSMEELSDLTLIINKINRDEELAEKAKWQAEHSVRCLFDAVSLCLADSNT